MRCLISRTMFVVLQLSLASSSFAFEISNEDGIAHQLTFDSADTKGIASLTIPSGRNGDEMRVMPLPVRVTLSTTGEAVALPRFFTALRIRNSKVIIEPTPSATSPTHSRREEGSREGSRPRLPIRKTPKPKVPAIPIDTAATFTKGRWQSLHVESLEFEVSGNQITGGRYRWRRDGKKGSITGGRVLGRTITYEWRDESYAGAGTLKLMQDGTLLYTDSSAGSTASYYVPR
mgnify:CR=1 FL=1